MSSNTADIWALSDLCTPWCVHVAVTLRIAERIEAGTTEIGALAEAAGADADALGRVLRHLAEHGVFEEPSPGSFTLNDAARALLDSSARYGLDLDGFGGRMAQAWSTLLTAVRTGRPAYHTLFGRPFWDDLEGSPELAAQFDALMGPGHGIPDPEVLPNGDWADVRTIVDVGGGTGMLLAEILRARPSVRGVLVDLPRTVARASATFDPAAVADRVTLSGQSFFDPLPRGDLFILKNVLADWPDDSARALLRRCAEAAAPAGRIVVLGGVTLADRASPELLMLVLVGGRSRTLAEFEQLAADAGLTVTTTGRQPSGRLMVECRPV
jgi:SAM-dependent methyltransferase